jgi:hypothetical protein
LVMERAFVATLWKVAADVGKEGLPMGAYKTPRARTSKRRAKAWGWVSLEYSSDTWGRTAGASKAARYRSREAASTRS